LPDLPCGGTLVFVEPPAKSAWLKQMTFSLRDEDIDPTRVNRCHSGNNALMPCPGYVTILLPRISRLRPPTCPFTSHHLMLSSLYGLAVVRIRSVMLPAASSSAASNNLPLHASCPPTFYLPPPPTTPTSYHCGLLPPPPLTSVASYHLPPPPTRTLKRICGQASTRLHHFLPLATGGPARERKISKQPLADLHSHIRFCIVRSSQPRYRLPADMSRTTRWTTRPATRTRFTCGSTKRSGTRVSI
jgi:hypothetical protein